MMEMWSDESLRLDKAAVACQARVKQRWRRDWMSMVRDVIDGGGIPDIAQKREQRAQRRVDRSYEESWQCRSATWRSRYCDSRSCIVSSNSFSRSNTHNYLLQSSNSRPRCLSL
uniref:Uncharacterized protein n=1 Tax=Hyaloperonospora arabidopsidis (strain Emoy2) TaxID=559515 RepID=M4BHD1_HYAAE